DARSRGCLDSKYRSEAESTKSQRGEGTLKYLTESGQRILKALDQIASEKNARPAQVAIAWLLTRLSITAPIASATSLEQLDDLIKGTTLQLDPDSIERLNQASAWET